MDKRLFLVGALVFMLGIAAFWAGAQQSVDQLSGQVPNSQPLVLNSGDDTFVPFTANGTEEIRSAYITSNVSINYYMMNSSAFESIRSMVTPDQRLGDAVKGLEGKGVFAVILNSSAGQYPYPASYTGLLPQPNFSSNYSSLPKGTYYMVFENPTSKNATVVYSITMGGMLPGQGQLVSSSTAPGIAGVVLAVIGIAIGIYSLFKSGKKEEGLAQEDVDRLYAGIEGRKGGKHGRAKGANSRKNGKAAGGR
ncbi:MAG: hypothetical protein KGI00_00125 [Candidatus Micrarchaeota archaeon]|nr:hypothetical protein [Candidatus Micrarchaeota archaeon]MDE1849123.1 hypothetical protein [Candidatus Micrarchaeota archaeon]